MINAKDAYRKSIINSKAKSYIDELEKAINKAIVAATASSLGTFSATISISMEEHNTNSSIRNAIVEELVSSGYRFEFVYAKPLPLGCSSDQWNFNNGHIKVRWDSKGERE